MFDQFLQSQEWKNITIKQGGTIIEFKDGSFFGVIKKMKLGFKQLYIGRAKLYEEELQLINKRAKELKVDFIKIDPANSDSDFSQFKKVKDFQPATTYIIDLKKSEDELFSSLHSKTRYNIKLAKRKGVTTRIGNIDEIDIFYQLITQTYSRKNISTYSKEYYLNIIKNNPFAYLVFAEYEGKVIVANIIIRHGNTVTYLHGGSDKKYKAVMAPQLLQWEEILRSKEDGFEYYDFWGIAPDENPNHPFAGITRFKKGFGGFVYKYPGTFEIGVSKKYFLYNILKKLR